MPILRYKFQISVYILQESGPVIVGVEDNFISHQTSQYLIVAVLKVTLIFVFNLIFVMCRIIANRINYLIFALIVLIGSNYHKKILVLEIKTLLEIDNFFAFD